jgi:hypothetical protein
MTSFLTRSGLIALLALVSGCSANAEDSNSQQGSNNPGGNGPGGSSNVAGSASGISGAANGGAAQGGAASVGGSSPGSSGAGGGVDFADAGSSLECYSPTQNTDTAYDPGAQGCPCDDGAEDVCVMNVALICEQGYWQAVEDGPCQPMFDPCAPQDVMMVGGCEPAPVYFWNGTECVGQSGCSCEGADCDATFASKEECEASYTSCIDRFCGGFAGFTCTDAEYCAYEPGEYCGAADASSTCKPRPTACTKELNPVCGCDGMSYGNACEANAAGTGIYTLGECGTNN